LLDHLGGVASEVALEDLKDATGMQEGVVGFELLGVASFAAAVHRVASRRRVMTGVLVA